MSRERSNCRVRARPVEGEVDHRRGVQRQHLAHQQAADHGQAQRLAQLGAMPPPSISGSAPSSAARVVIRMGRKRSRQAWKMASRGARPAVAFGVEGEVDHHDRVLLDDADQQDDADHRNHVELVPGAEQRQQRADGGRRQGAQDGQGWM
jgi:hypothetical protein